MSLLQQFKRNLSAQFSVNSSFIQIGVFNKVNIAENSRLLHRHIDVRINLR